MHFHSYPFTSQQSKEKVIQLARLLAPITPGPLPAVDRLFHRNPEGPAQGLLPSLSVTLMRRFMLRIAERLARREGLWP